MRTTQGLDAEVDTHHKPPSPKVWTQRVGASHTHTQGIDVAEETDTHWLAVHKGLAQHWRAPHTHLHLRATLSNLHGARHVLDLHDLRHVLGLNLERHVLDLLLHVECHVSGEPHMSDLLGESHLLGFHDQGVRDLCRVLGLLG